MFGCFEIWGRETRKISEKKNYKSLCLNFLCIFQGILNIEGVVDFISFICYIIFTVFFDLIYLYFLNLRIGEKAVGKRNFPSLFQVSFSFSQESSCVLFFFLFP